MTLQDLHMKLFNLPLLLPVYIKGTQKSIINPHLYKCDPEILAFEPHPEQKTVAEVLYMVQKCFDADIAHSNGKSYRPNRLTELRISRRDHCDGGVIEEVENWGSYIELKVKNIERVK